MVSEFHHERFLTTTSTWNFQGYRLRTSVDDLQSEKLCNNIVLVLFPVNANTFFWQGLMLRALTADNLTASSALAPLTLIYLTPLDWRMRQGGGRWKKAFEVCSNQKCKKLRQSKWPANGWKSYHIERYARARWNGAMN